MVKAKRMPVVDAVTRLEEEITRRVEQKLEGAVMQKGEKFTEGYATSLRQRFLRFVRYLLPKLRLELDNSTGELSWSPHADQAREPAAVFQDALLKRNGEHVLAYLRSRAEDLGADSLRAELSAFRTIYRIFQKQGLTSFDPDRIDTPDLKEHVRIPIVERMLESRFESVGTRNTRRCELRFYIDHVCAAAGIEVAEDLEREAIANLRSPRTEALDSADSTVLDTVTGQMILQADSHLPAFCQAIEERTNKKHLLYGVRGFYRWLQQEGFGSFGLDELINRRRSIQAPAKKTKRRRVKEKSPRQTAEATQAPSPIPAKDARWERRVIPWYDSEAMAEFVRCRDAALEQLIRVEKLEFGDLVLLTRAQWKSTRSRLIIVNWSLTEPPQETALRLRRKTQELLECYVDRVRISPWGEEYDGSTRLFLSTDGGSLTVDDDVNSEELEPPFFYWRNRAVTEFMRELALDFDTVVQLKRAVVDLHGRRLFPPAGGAPHQELSEDLLAVLREWFTAVKLSPLQNIWNQNEDHAPLFVAADGGELTVTEL